MTQTAKITFRWADRNHIGEPLPVMRHNIEWTHDDGKTLAMLSDALQTPRPYVHADLLTETRLTRSEALKLTAISIGSLLLSAIWLIGFATVCQWIGSKF